MMARKGDETGGGSDGVVIAHVFTTPPVVIDEMQRERAHRRGMEVHDANLRQQVVEAAIASERRGAILAFVVAVLGLCAVTLLVALDRSVAGTMIFSLLVALVSAFIWGRTRLHAAHVTDPAARQRVDIETR
jgi:hypothetical protein